MMHFVVAALAALAVLPPAPGGFLALVNDSDFTVTHVYISPCEEEDWLGDLLGEDEVLAPGEELGFDIEAGCWDLRAVVENDELLDSYTVVAEDGDELVWTISNAD